MKQYECDVHIRQSVIVEAESEKEARSAVLNQYEAMMGIDAAHVSRVDVIEIAHPKTTFGRRGRGRIL